MGYMITVNPLLFNLLSFIFKRFIFESNIHQSMFNNNKKEEKGALRNTLKLITTEMQCDFRIV